MKNVQNPPITRTTWCSGEVTFYDLHKAISIAFGWTHGHEPDFSLFENPVTKSKIEVMHSEPNEQDDQLEPTGSRNHLTLSENIQISGSTTRRPKTSTTTWVSCLTT